MKHVPDQNDVLRHRAFVVSALARELNTEVTLDDSGYYIPETDTHIGNGSAEDILAKPHLMKEVKERIARNTPIE